MSKKLVETGDKVWLLYESMFRSNDDEKLREATVVKHNKSSFYATQDKYHDHNPNRYDQKTKTHSTGFGYKYTAYTDPNVYYEEQRVKKEKEDLRLGIADLMRKPLSVESLKVIKENIEEELK